MYTH
jgi:hypothetical protein